MLPFPSSTLGVIIHYPSLSSVSSFGAKTRFHRPLLLCPVTLLRQTGILWLAQSAPPPAAAKTPPRNNSMASYISFERNAQDIALLLLRHPQAARQSRFCRFHPRGGVFPGPRIQVVQLDYQEMGGFPAPPLSASQ
jgi:hypothetical protein